MTQLCNASEDDGQVIPPTAKLPPIRTIYSEPIPLHTIHSALAYLSKLYDEPEVRGVRYVRRTRCPLSRQAGSKSNRRSNEKNTDVLGHQIQALLSSNTDSDGDRELDPGTRYALEIDQLRADAFERSYAVQWLTVLVSHIGESTSLSGSQSLWEDVVQRAARLLAVCAGAASAGVRLRTFVFTGANSSRSSSRSPGAITPVTPIDGDTVPVFVAPEIKVRITDMPLDNQDYSSVGAQTWGGACLLSDMIVRSGDSPDLGLPSQSHSTTPFRVLELGAGTGLVGITACKVLEARGVHAEVVSTDFHPDVLENLRRNFTANFPRSQSSESTIATSVKFLDWSVFSSQAGAQEKSSPLADKFDVVYGADIIYELEHTRWIKACVELLLRKPDPVQNSSETPRFHLVIPLRRTHIAEAHTVEDIFPLVGEVPTGTQEAFNTLAITAKEEIVCADLWNESMNEVEYVHYTITWI